MVEMSMSANQQKARVVRRMLPPQRTADHRPAPGQLGKLIGRNRMLILNVFKFLAFRKQAISLIGQLNKKYAGFVKQSDMALFDMLEKEKRLNHVGSD